MAASASFDIEPQWHAIAPLLGIHISSDGRGSRLIRLRGGLDLASADRFVMAVELLIDDRATTRVILGCDELEFMDSSGAHALARIRDLLVTMNRSLVVLNPSPVVRRVLTLSRLGHLEPDPAGGDDAA